MNKLVLICLFLTAMRICAFRYGDYHYYAVSGVSSASSAVAACTSSGGSLAPVVDDAMIALAVNQLCNPSCFTSTRYDPATETFGPILSNGSTPSALTPARWNDLLIYTPNFYSVIIRSAGQGYVGATDPSAFILGPYIAYALCAVSTNSIAHTGPVAGAVHCLTNPANSRDACSGRGLCQSGVCACISGWGGMDCDRYTYTASGISNEYIPVTATSEHRTFVDAAADCQARFSAALMYIFTFAEQSSVGYYMLPNASPGLYQSSYWIGGYDTITFSGTSSNTHVFSWYGTTDRPQSASSAGSSSWQYQNWFYGEPAYASGSSPVKACVEIYPSGGAAWALETCSTSQAYICKRRRCGTMYNGNPNACSGNGYCSYTSSACVCKSGFTGTDCQNTICYGVSNSDPKVCSGNGLCIGLDMCQCSAGWTGPTCSQTTCFGLESTSTAAVCSGYGVCTGPNQCMCQPGYTGAQCQFAICSGYSSLFPVGSNAMSSAGVYDTGCNNRGYCVAPDRCLCDASLGYSGSTCENAVCFGKLGGSSTSTTMFDPDIILRARDDEITGTASACNGLNKGGQCTGPNQCQCNNGYQGEECLFLSCHGTTISVSEFPVSTTDVYPASWAQYSSIGIYNQAASNEPYPYTIVSPLTATASSVCSGNGMCRTPNVCTCAVGYSGQYCEKFQCYGIDSTNSSVCSGNGVCSALDQCTCLPAHFGDMCTESYCFGFAADDSKNVCSGNGRCVATDTCACLDGFYGAQCNGVSSSCTVPNTNTITCTNSTRGTCNTAINTCTCTNAGYTGVGCEHNICYGILDSDSAVCGGHGSCVDANRCVCDPGYSGTNCSLFTCPSVLNNATGISSACAGNGICIGPNMCWCTAQGYTGPDCNSPICHGSVGSSACSGHGTCTSPDTCSCSSLYYGAECDLYSCYGIDARYTDQVCSGGRGKCTGPNVCTCNSGFYGNQCQNAMCSAVYNATLNSSLLYDADYLVSSYVYSHIPSIYTTNRTNNDGCIGSAVCASPWYGCYSNGLGLLLSTNVKRTCSYTTPLTPATNNTTPYPTCTSTSTNGSFIVQDYYARLSPTTQQISCSITVSYVPITVLQSSITYGGPVTQSEISNFLQSQSITSDLPFYNIDPYDWETTNSVGWLKNTHTYVDGSLNTVGSCSWSTVDNYVAFDILSPFQVATERTCAGIEASSLLTCSGRGVCVDQDLCDCAPGYSGANCETRLCYGTLATSPSACSGAGTCVRGNLCDCASGYSGNECQYHSCYGVSVLKAQDVCSGVGTCVSPDSCACRAGFTGNKCQYPVCFGASLAPNVTFPDSWTTKPCSLHGACVAPDSCVCDKGYSGPLCNVAPTCSFESINTTTADDTVDSVLWKNVIGPVYANISMYTTTQNPGIIDPYAQSYGFLRTRSVSPYSSCKILHRVLSNSSASSIPYYFPGCINATSNATFDLDTTPLITRPLIRFNMSLDYLINTCNPDQTLTTYSRYTPTTYATWYPSVPVCHVDASATLDDILGSASFFRHPQDAHDFCGVFALKKTFVVVPERYTFLTRYQKQGDPVGLYRYSNVTVWLDVYNVFLARFIPLGAQLPFDTQQVLPSVHPAQVYDEWARTSPTERVDEAMYSGAVARKQLLKRLSRFEYITIRMKPGNHDTEYTDCESVSALESTIWNYIASAQAAQDSTLSVNFANAAYLYTTNQASGNVSCGVRKRLVFYRDDLRLEVYIGKSVPGFYLPVEDLYGNPPLSSSYASLAVYPVEEHGGVSITGQNHAIIANNVSILCCVWNRARFDKPLFFIDRMALFTRIVGAVFDDTSPSEAITTLTTRRPGIVVEDRFSGGNKNTTMPIVVHEFWSVSENHTVTSRMRNKAESDTRWNRKQTRPSKKNGLYESYKETYGVVIKDTIFRSAPSFQAPNLYMQSAGPYADTISCHVSHMPLFQGKGNASSLVQDLSLLLQNNAFVYSDTKGRGLLHIGRTLQSYVHSTPERYNDTLSTEITVIPAVRTNENFAIYMPLPSVPAVTIGSGNSSIRAIPQFQVVFTPNDTQSLLSRDATKGLLVGTVTFPPYGTPDSNNSALHRIYGVYATNNLMNTNLGIAVHIQCDTALYISASNTISVISPALASSAVYNQEYLDARAALVANVVAPTPFLKERIDPVTLYASSFLIDNEICAVRSSLQAVYLNQTLDTAVFVEDNIISPTTECMSGYPCTELGICISGIRTCVNSSSACLPHYLKIHNNIYTDTRVFVASSTVNTAILIQSSDSFKTSDLLNVLWTGYYQKPAFSPNDTIYYTVSSDTPTQTDPMSYQYTVALLQKLNPSIVGIQYDTRIELSITNNATTSLDRINLHSLLCDQACKGTCDSGQVDPTRYEPSDLASVCYNVTLFDRLDYAVLQCAHEVLNVFPMRYPSLSLILQKPQYKQRSLLIVKSMSTIGLTRGTIPVTGRWKDGDVIGSLIQPKAIIELNEDIAQDANLQKHAIWLHLMEIRFRNIKFQIAETKSASSAFGGVIFSRDYTVASSVAVNMVQLMDCVLLGGSQIDSGMAVFFEDSFSVTASAPATQQLNYVVMFNSQVSMFGPVIVPPTLNGYSIQNTTFSNMQVGVLRSIPTRGYTFNNNTMTDVSASNAANAIVSVSNSVCVPNMLTPYGCEMYGNIALGPISPGEVDRDSPDVSEATYGTQSLYSVSNVAMSYTQFYNNSNYGLAYGISITGIPSISCSSQAMRQLKIANPNIEGVVEDVCCDRGLSTQYCCMGPCNNQALIAPPPYCLVDPNTDPLGSDFLYIYFKTLRQALDYCRSRPVKLIYLLQNTVHQAVSSGLENSTSSSMFDMTAQARRSMITSSGALAGSLDMQISTMPDWLNAVYNRTGSLRYINNAFNPASNGFIIETPDAYAPLDAPWTHRKAMVVTSAQMAGILVPGTGYNSAHFDDIEFVTCAAMKAAAQFGTVGSNQPYTSNITCGYATVYDEQTWPILDISGVQDSSVSNCIFRSSVYLSPANTYNPTGHTSGITRYTASSAVPPSAQYNDIFSDYLLRIRGISWTSRTTVTNNTFYGAKLSGITITSEGSASTPTANDTQAADAMAGYVSISNNYGAFQLGSFIAVSGLSRVYIRNFTCTWWCGGITSGQSGVLQVSLAQIPIASYTPLDSTGPGYESERMQILGNTIIVNTAVENSTGAGPRTLYQQIAGANSGYFSAYSLAWSSTTNRFSTSGTWNSNDNYQGWFMVRDNIGKGHAIGIRTYNFHSSLLLLNDPTGFVPMYEDNLRPLRDLAVLNYGLVTPRGFIGTKYDVKNGVAVMDDSLALSNACNNLCLPTGQSLSCMVSRFYNAVTAGARFGLTYFSDVASAQVGCIYNPIVIVIARPPSDIIPTGSSFRAIHYEDINLVHLGRDIILQGQGPTTAYPDSSPVTVVGHHTYDFSLSPSPSPQITIQSLRFEPLVSSAGSAPSSVQGGDVSSCVPQASPADTGIFGTAAGQLFVSDTLFFDSVCDGFSVNVLKDSAGTMSDPYSGVPTVAGSPRAVTYSWFKPLWSNANSNYGALVTTATVTFSSVYAGFYMTEDNYFVGVSGATNPVTNQALRPHYGSFIDMRDLDEQKSRVVLDTVYTGARFVTRNNQILRFTFADSMHSVCNPVGCRACLADDASQVYGPQGASSVTIVNSVTTCSYDGAVWIERAPKVTMSNNQFLKCGYGQSNTGFYTQSAAVYVMLSPVPSSTNTIMQGSWIAIGESSTDISSRLVLTSNTVTGHSTWSSSNPRNSPKVSDSSSPWCPAPAWPTLQAAYTPPAWAQSTSQLITVPYPLLTARARTWQQELQNVCSFPTPQYDATQSTDFTGFWLDVPGLTVNVPPDTATAYSQCLSSSTAPASCLSAASSDIDRLDGISISGNVANSGIGVGLRLTWCKQGDSTTLLDDPTSRSLVGTGNPFLARFVSSQNLGLSGYATDVVIGTNDKTQANNPALSGLYCTQGCPVLDVYTSIYKTWFIVLGSVAGFFVVWIVFCGFAAVLRDKRGALKDRSNQYMLREAYQRRLAVGSKAQGYEQVGTADEDEHYISMGMNTPMRRTPNTPKYDIYE